MTNYQGMHVAKNGHREGKTQAVNKALTIEQLRLLATRIHQFGHQQPIRILAVTSAVASEGKTTVATNLAGVMAQMFEKRTLLIDADFRRPGVAKMLGQQFTKGLVEVLRDQAVPAAARWQLQGQRLSVLPLIKPEPHMASLLATPEVRTRFLAACEGFDLVIVDTPPVLPLADVTLLSDLVDGFLMVVRAERTPRRLIASALKNIPREKVFGFVLNGTKTFGHAAYGYQYYGPSYYINPSARGK